LKKTSHATAFTAETNAQQYKRTLKIRLAKLAPQFYMNWPSKRM